MNEGREGEVKALKGRQRIIGLVGYSKDFGSSSERDRKLQEVSEQTSDVTCLTFEQDRFGC